MKKKFKHAIFNLLQGIEKSSGKAKTAIWLSNVSDSDNRGAVSHLKHMEQPALSEKQKKVIILSKTMRFFFIFLVCTF